MAIEVNSSKVHSRWSACGIHLAISVIVMILLLCLIFFAWFPYDLIYAGGIQGLKILAVVDLVLGPLLTLIVFAPAKKSLRFDLSMIALLQTVCLLGGLWLVYNERPLVQVLADDGVHLLAASDFSYYQVEIPDLPGASPKSVMLDLPEDRAQLATIKFSSEMADEKPFILRTDLYLPLSEISIKRYQQRMAFIREPIEPSVLKQLPSHEKRDCIWIPLHSTHAGGYACSTYSDGIIRLSERKL